MAKGIVASPSAIRMSSVEKWLPLIFLPLGLHFLAGHQEEMLASEGDPTGVRAQLETAHGPEA